MGGVASAQFLADHLSPHLLKLTQRLIADIG
jgi:hypothetical protein